MEKKSIKTVDQLRAAYPELTQKLVDQVLSGKATGKNQPRDFLTVVNTIVREKNCSQAQAMSIAARGFPALHQAYIDQANAS